MTKLTGAALDRKVAQALGVKSVHNCEAWGHTKTPEDEAFEQLEADIKRRENDDDDTQIYASPWKGLTEYEFAAIYNKWTDANGSTPWGLYRAIEKALKGKNHG